MIGNSIVTPIQAIWSRVRAINTRKRMDLHTYWLHPERLPRFVGESPTARRFLDLLGPLAWAQLPERNLVRDWGQPAISNAAFLAACLIKLEEARDSMGDLLLYLQEHAPLIWLAVRLSTFSFKLVSSRLRPKSQSAHGTSLGTHVTQNAEQYYPTLAE